MKWWIFSLVFGVWVLGLAGCGQPERRGDADLLALVDTLGRASEQAFLAGDVEGLLEYYDEDVISMPAGHAMIRGKAALRRQTEAVLASGLRFEVLESRPEEVRAGGAYVYEVGTYRQAVVFPGSDAATASEGKYVTIWKRQPDGELKIAVEMYNSNSMPEGISRGKAPFSFKNAGIYAARDDT